ncbi:3-oxoacyl-[acyl-carrier-protein] synthase III C-terminal domain-containing protein [Vibrio splendidus]|uniref:3-oxoacyl-[acyl-carrier-protein] synthase III C-terminal domain-containing protein n=1 Tax=Vibrio splendidus TaxID=29497 RepID=UPI00076A48A6|nr:3-oxoacyl-[acyl-carrier-protein] synthase III C-terminal domain-containing protein [Vibrio splendidus]PHX05755.1 3-oxoacyl-[acyl-carrier-protein] synthase 3 [Vibrio splendidus]
MANSKFNNGKITGVVTVVPQDVRCIDDEVHLYGGNEKQIARIKRAIGLDKRHVTDESITTLDLCVDAAEKLISGIDIDKKDIDGLIFVTQTPDYLQPSNAAIAHGVLGLSTDAASFDIGLGCSGYVYGLWMAHMMVASQTCKRVLLLAGDTLSKCVNPRDRATAPLFGDAGTATLIEYTEADVESYFSLHTNGAGYQHILQPAGGFRKPSSLETAVEKIDEEGNYRSENDLAMNGGEVFNFSIKTEPPAIKEILEFARQDINDVDYVVFHQANKYIITNIAKRLKLPMDKVPCETVSKYGNQSSASIPCTINDAIGRNLSISDKRLILSGFGVGLSWASAIVNLSGIYSPPVLIYQPKEIK